MENGEGGRRGEGEGGCMREGEGGKVWAEKREREREREGGSITVSVCLWAESGVSAEALSEGGISLTLFLFQTFNAAWSSVFLPCVWEALAAAMQSGRSWRQGLVCTNWGKGREREGEGIYSQKKGTMQVDAVRCGVRLHKMRDYSKSISSGLTQLRKVMWRLRLCVTMSLNGLLWQIWKLF